MTPKHSRNRIATKGRISLTVAAKASQGKSRRSRRQRVGRARMRTRTGPQSDLLTRCFEVAYPRLGLPASIGMESRVPVITEVLRDSYTLTTDSNGNANLVILPDFVGTNSTCPVNGGTATQTISFFNVNPAIAAGSAPAWTTANAPNFSATQQDTTLSYLMSATNSGASPFLRARLLSVSVQYEYIGDTLYDGGLVTIQHFDNRDSSSSISLACPYSSSIITPIYHVGPVREGWIMSLPCADRASVGLFLCPANQFMDGNNGSALFGAVSIWLSTPHASTNVCRVTVSRMAQFEVDTTLGASVYSQMAKRQGPPNQSELDALEGLQTGDETGITFCNGDPLRAVAERFGIDVDAAYKRIGEYTKSLAGHAMRHVSRAATSYALGGGGRTQLM